MAASLGLKYSRVEQILTSFPHDFPAAVFATLGGWYTASRSMFWKKLDDLEDAFKELHKGALFNRIVNAHLVVLQRVSSLPRIHLPSSDTSDESFGEAVMNAVEIVPSCHLCLLRTLLREILSDGNLLTVAAACGIAPVVAVAVTESRMRPSFKAARVFLPWFAQSDLIPKAKYLRLKFGFQCASLLPVFNNIVDDFRPMLVASTLPTTDEHDAALVHGLPTEQNALTAHILFEWWCSALLTLTEKLTRLQCAFTGISLGHTYYTAWRSYGHYLYHFSPATSECTPPTSLSQLPEAPAGCGEGVAVNRDFIVGPHVPMHIDLRQISKETREINNVGKNKAGDSGTLADDPPPAKAAAAQVMHEMEQVLGPQPSTSSDGKKSSSNHQGRTQL